MNISDDALLRVIQVAIVMAVLMLGLTVMLMQRARARYRRFLERNKRKLQSREAIALGLTTVEEELKPFLQRKKRQKQKPEDLNTRLRKAGFYGEGARRIFALRILRGSGFGAFVAYVCTHLFQMEPPLLWTLIGAASGALYPSIALEFEIDGHQHELTKFLPLFLQELAIGTSGSLSVLSGVEMIVGLADNRGVTNPVTELFRRALLHIHMGTNAADVIKIVGKESENLYIEHACHILSTSEEYGAALTTQLEELSESMHLNHELDVERRLRSLPAKATGPLFFIFMGFCALSGAGLTVAIQGAFPSDLH